MHKSIDLEYHLLESHLGYYPSLMSPLRQLNASTPLSGQNSIFDRLQADTELRLRARLNSVSQPRLVRPKAVQPIEDILIRKGKDRETRLRQLAEQEELKRANQLQDRPLINDYSKAIMRNKYTNSGRNCKKLDDMQSNKHILVIESEPSAKIKPTSSTQQNVLVKQLENRYKLPTEQPIAAKRKYIPMFNKTFNKKDQMQVKKPQPGSEERKDRLNLKYKESRPASDNISRCTVHINEALTYQQIIRNRISKLDCSLNH